MCRRKRETCRTGKPIGEPRGRMARRCQPVEDRDAGIASQAIHDGRVQALAFETVVETAEHAGRVRERLVAPGT